MENRFTSKMTQRTNEELLQIVTKQRNDYQPDAITAAEQEIKNRDIWDEDLIALIDEKKNEVLPSKTNIYDPTAMWKAARNGILIFCVIHFFFENLTGNSKSTVLPVAFNYFISAWYVKKQIAKGKEIQSLLLMGLSVSGVVFLFRLILGTIFYLLMTQ